MEGFEVAWDSGRTLLTTRVSGQLSIEQVARYSETLRRTLAQIPSDTTFVWFSSATGYDALADRAAHEALRSIVPRTLAQYGFRTSLLDLHEGEVSISRTRGIGCRAIAHVHHDAGKMAFFDERFGRANERYFSDEGLAQEWLATRCSSLD